MVILVIPHISIILSQKHSFHEYQLTEVIMSSTSPVARFILRVFEKHELWQLVTTICVFGCGD